MDVGDKMKSDWDIVSVYRWLRAVETLFRKTSLCITESCNLFYINKSVIPIVSFHHGFFIYANDF